MPAEAPSPAQTSFTWKPADAMFKAEGIPVFPIDDAGNHNRYPLMRLTATDRATGQTLATVDVVLPVSEETTCSDCHATGGTATRAGGISWSPLATWRSSRARISCCCTTTAWAPPDGVEARALRRLPLQRCAGSRGHRARWPAGRETDDVRRDACLSQRPDVERRRRTVCRRLGSRRAARRRRPQNQSCYLCHPGKSTQCLRGAMTNTVTCQNCHGGMSAVGGTTALAAGGSIDGRNDGRSRRPWTGPAALPVMPHRRRGESPYAGGRVTDVH